MTLKKIKLKPIGMLKSWQRQKPILKNPNSGNVMRLVRLKKNIKKLLTNNVKWYIISNIVIITILYLFLLM